MSRRLLLLRHGRTAWNESGRAQGHADVPLDAVGQRQARQVAVHVAALAPAALWTSDLTRARETCAALERATGLAAKVDERFREFDVGERQGMVQAEFAARFPAEHDAWTHGRDEPCVPGAESTTDVVRRMVPALREAHDSLADGETGVVVTHGAGLRVAVLELLGWPQSSARQLRGMDNCAWAELVDDAERGVLRLAAWNLRPTDVPRDA